MSGNVLTTHRDQFLTMMCALTTMMYGGCICVTSMCCHVHCMSACMFEIAHMHSTDLVTPSNIGSPAVLYGQPV